MIEIDLIPVDLTVDRLTRAGIDPEEAARFVENWGDAVRPAARYGEAPSADVVGPDAMARGWGESVIAGLCGLGPGFAARLETPSHPAPPLEITRLVLGDALDYLEYRVRLYLKPVGRSPGPRVVPGCESMPMDSSGRIVQLLGPPEPLGLKIALDGAVDPVTGLAFVYPAGPAPIIPSRCDLCARKYCPARRFEPEDG